MFEQSVAYTIRLLFNAHRMDLECIQHAGAIDFYFYFLFWKTSKTSLKVAPCIDIKNKNLKALQDPMSFVKPIARPTSFEAFEAAFQKMTIEQCALVKLEKRRQKSQTLFNLFPKYTFHKNLTKEEKKQF
jgi:hypothetical protein